MKIAYYVEYGYHYLEHIEALYKEHEGMIITLSPITAEMLQKKDYHVKLANGHTPDLLRYVDADVVVYPGNRKIPDPNKKHVIVNHGVSDKTFLTKMGTGNFDLVLLPGQKDYNAIAETGANMGKYKVVGYNKFSLLNDMEPINLFNNDKKTIIYAPTWNYSPGHGGINIRSSWTYIKTICKAIGKDYNLIIKPHPVIDMLISSDFYLYIIDPAKDNIKYIDDYRSLAYMQQADLMLTDISSVAYEWLYFDKPIVFINPNPAAVKKGTAETAIWNVGELVEFRKDVIGIDSEVSNENLLRTGIEHAFANSEKQQHERDKLLKHAYLSPRDGLSAKRAIEAIRTMYEGKMLL